MRSISGSVISSQAILALFFSTPDKPRRNMSPITKHAKQTKIIYSSNVTLRQEAYRWGFGGIFSRNFDCKKLK